MPIEQIYSIIVLFIIRFLRLLVVRITNKFTDVVLKGDMIAFLQYMYINKFVIVHILFEFY